MTRKQKVGCWSLSCIIGIAGFGIGLLFRSTDPNNQIMAIIFMLLWGLNTLIALTIMIAEMFIDD